MVEEVTTCGQGCSRREMYWVKYRHIPCIVGADNICNGHILLPITYSLSAFIYRPHVVQGVEKSQKSRDRRGNDAPSYSMESNERHASGTDCAILHALLLSLLKKLCAAFKGFSYRLFFPSFSIISGSCFFIVVICVVSHHVSPFMCPARLPLWKRKDGYRYIVAPCHPHPRDCRLAE